LHFGAGIFLTFAVSILSPISIFMHTTMLLPKVLLERAFRLMATAKAMTEHYEANFKFVSKYVHATSRGHEAIQLALGMQLTPKDVVFPYYRDDSILLGIGHEL
jgi:2-oxoisovalerate dehydrogenase E1 component